MSETTASLLSPEGYFAPKPTSSPESQDVVAVVAVLHPEQAVDVLAPSSPRRESLMQPIFSFRLRVDLVLILLERQEGTLVVL
eukprot:4467421-Heterocapsa_arctica.AAC.1